VPEGGRVEVDGGDALRGRRGRGRRWWRDNDQERCTDSLRKRTVATRFRAEVEAAACFGVWDEAVACSGAGIEAGRWQQQCDSFSGDRRVRDSAGMKIC
jgi:hypothetical protein